MLIGLCHTLEMKDITQYLQSQINLQKHKCDIAVGDVFVYSHFHYGQM